MTELLALTLFMVLLVLALPWLLLLANDFRAFFVLVAALYCATV